MVKHSRKSSKRSRSRHGGRKTKTRRHRKSTHRRRTVRKTRGGLRCFDARGNADPSGSYNIDGSVNDSCPLE